MSDNNTRKQRRACANCMNVTTEDDLYCRYCGCIFSGKPYNPRENLWATACIYGPAPVKRVHSCSCGFSWTTFDMIVKEKYCPRCGNKCTITDERD